MSPSAKPRLLVVEDEAIVVADGIRRLALLGYEVVGTAFSGEDSLLLADEFRPDLVLMDIHLRGAMDGITAAGVLRTRWQIPVVFLTSYGEGAIFQRAKAVEPLGYVLKPFEDRELRIVIEMALYKNQVECQLRASEARHQSILESAMHGFWLVDARGCLLEVNQSYCRMSGYNASELLGRHISDLLGGNGSAATVAEKDRRIEQLMTLGDQRFESRLRRKDGSLFDVEVSCQYHSGQGGFGVAFLRDITAQKHVERYRDMGSHVLSILNRSGNLRQSMQRVLAVVQEQSGADAVAMRLQDGNEFPYFVHSGFPNEMVGSEHTIRACAGVRPDGGGCPCGQVIAGALTSGEPWVTPRGSYWVHDGLPQDGLVPEQGSSGTHCNRCLREGDASLVVVPICANDQIIGLLQLNSSHKGWFTLDVVEILEGVAILIGEALLRKRAEQSLSQSKADLRVLATRLQAVREQERTSLARELHDFFGQHLTALQMDLMWMDRHLQAAPVADLSILRDKIVAMVPVIERLTEQTQALCASLRPSILYDLGLQAAIEWQVEDTAKRSGLIGRVSLPAGDLALDDDRALALFRIVQESLVNVVRHAQASHVEVLLHVDECELVLEIQDDGRGFGAEVRAGSHALGLLGMRERMEVFGGSVEFGHAPGAAGACVRVLLPLATFPMPPTASL